MCEGDITSSPVKTTSTFSAQVRVSGNSLARSAGNRKVGCLSPPRSDYLAIQNPLLLDLTKRHAYTQGESVVGKKDLKTFSWSNGIIFLNRR